MMPDRETVSNGLCEAIGIIHAYIPKRYWGYGEQACRDAIELLKGPEQNSNCIEVIRCKDCVHFSADEIPEAGCGFCELHSGTRYEADFCSSAGKQVKLDG